VLSDVKTKDIYDKYGKAGLEAHEKGMDPEAAGFGSGFPGGGGGRGGNSQQFHFNGSPGGGGFDPFSQVRVPYAFACSKRRLIPIYTSMHFFTKMGSR
jgi:DnaJ-class molecular chaperone